METNLLPGTRCTYTAPFLAAPITGTVTPDDVDGSLMFIPDAEHHAAVLAVGYEPEAGLYLPDGTPDTEGVIVVAI